MERNCCYKQKLAWTCGGHHKLDMENANENCPGPQSETAGKSDSCAGCPNQETCATKGPDPDLVGIAERMATVKHKILVCSCKGGVGKSTFSAQLSFALAGMDHQVGLMDLDICGPSIPKMLGLQGHEIHQSNFGWSPIYVEDNLAVMSVGLMIPPNTDHEPAIWRGPRKTGLIKHFLKDVYWGDIDFLVIDSPPGTSDEHITLVQCLAQTGIDGAIIVTTPQEVSLTDVRKGVTFCKKTGVPVLGVVENMSGLSQQLTDFKFMKLIAETGSSIDVTQDMISCIRKNAPELLDVVACSQVFDSSGGGAERMCQEMGVPFLGKVPLDPQLGRAAEQGKSCFEDNKCFVSAPTLKSIIQKVIASIKMKEDLSGQEEDEFAPSDLCKDNEFFYRSDE